MPAGGTVVNIHHANEINPYINYPFFNLDKQTAYIEEAHAKGIKVKLYDTIRELTYRAHELFALRSLGDEILNDGEGRGALLAAGAPRGSVPRRLARRRALTMPRSSTRARRAGPTTTSKVSRGWPSTSTSTDSTSTTSRSAARRSNGWCRCSHARRDEVVIDLHSANQFNPRDGHINSAMLYMEHFPYMSRLWFGEYFDYSQPADYWMTEVSGLPFGLMGEMLQDGGHPYRGMLFGMTSRLYGQTDPRPVWALMNDFGISASRMRGYWLDDTPARTGNPRVLATTYVGDNRALIALASWSDRDETVALDLDLEAMGLSGDVRLYAPAVAGLQPFAELDPRAVVVPANQGLFVRVDGPGSR